MRYSNATDVSQDQNRYYPMTYTHPDGRETKYEIQQFRDDDGRKPAYVVSEAPDNTGPGFDNAHTRYAVSHQAMSAALALNNPEVFPERKAHQEDPLRPQEILLYQQRPDGNFERVTHREIGRDARSNVDIEMEQNDPKLYESYKKSQESSADRGPEFAEISRTLYTRDEVEKVTGGPLRAPQETRQQMEAVELRDVTGPAIDRNAERANLAQQQAQQDQRSQEQSQQMNQHQQQHRQSQQF